MAFPGNVNWYLSSAKYAAITTWATGQAKSVGDIVKQTGTPTVGNERAYVCIAAGTTGGGADPLTVFTRGNKITDNTVTWQEATGLAALNGDLTNTPTWTAGAKNTAITLGHVIKSDDGQVTLICTTAGTSGNGAEPTWSTTPGNTTADNTVTWTTLKAGGATFASWAAPAARMNNVLATNWADQTAQTIFVGSDHAETQTSSITFTARGSEANPNRWICVNVAGSMPPVAADLATTGSISVSGSGLSININGALKWVYGLIFTNGTSGTCDINVNQDTGTPVDILYEQCQFRCGAGAGGNSSPIKGTSGAGRVRFKDCIIRFTNASQAIDIGGYLEFDNVTLDSGGTKPTTLFAQTLVGSSNSTTTRWTGCDFSFFTSGTFITMPQNRLVHHTFEDCNFPAGITLCNTSNLIIGDEWCQFIRCALGVGGDHDYSLFSLMGSQVVVTDVTRTGGAQSPSGTDFAWKLASGARCNNGSTVLESSRAGYYHDSTDLSASATSLTLYGIANMSAMPTDIQVWAQAQYLGNASNSQGLQTTSRGNPLGSGTSLTADSSDWDDNVTARQNTHAYALGDVISLASNPGRVFFCTTAGTSAGSEPGDYASAVDGGSVTDNTAVFRAGWRFSITLNITPAQQGNVHVSFFVGVASTTVYFDPDITVS